MRASPGRDEPSAFPPFRFSVSTTSLQHSVRHPKPVISDTGLASALLGRDVDGLGSPLNPMTGPILESFVTMELIKQSAWSNTHPTIRHWRDRNGPEVDLIVEDASGRVAGIEVKASTTVSSHDHQHLRTLRDRMGDRYVAGVVLYLGSRAVNFGDRTWALPVPALWGD